MIIWDYRLFLEPDGNYIFREVFYDENDNIIACSQDGFEPYGETLDELRQCLDDLKAALHRPVLTLSDIPVPQQNSKKDLNLDTLSADAVRKKLDLPLAMKLNTPVN